jgi:hypothetical protein
MRQSEGSSSSSLMPQVRNAAAQWDRHDRIFKRRDRNGHSRRVLERTRRRLAVLPPQRRQYPPPSTSLMHVQSFKSTSMRGSRASWASSPRVGCIRPRASRAFGRTGRSKSIWSRTGAASIRGGGVTSKRALELQRAAGVRQGRAAASTCADRWRSERQRRN